MSEPRPITAESAFASLERLAAERPSYVYVPPAEDGACVYFVPETAEPSCIVGHVLAEHGYGPDNVIEGECFTTIVHGYDKGIEAEATAVAVLGAAQELQDCGEPWATAVAAVKREWGQV